MCGSWGVLLKDGGDNSSRRLQVHSFRANTFIWTQHFENKYACQITRNIVPQMLLIIAKNTNQRKKFTYYAMAPGGRVL